MMGSGHRRKPRYICTSCRRTGIQAAPADEDVSAAVWEVIKDRLPERLAAVEPRDIGPDSDLREVEAKIASIDDRYATGEITEAQWMSVSKALHERLEKLRVFEPKLNGRGRGAGSIRT